MCEFCEKRMQKYKKEMDGFPTSCGIDYVYEWSMKLSLRFLKEVFIKNGDNLLHIDSSVLPLEGFDLNFCPECGKDLRGGD